MLIESATGGNRQPSANVVRGFVTVHAVVASGIF
jgi:hypothetical protein